MSKAKSGDGAANLSQQKIKAALKQVLKQRGFTYKDVAEAWDCSEPTVKRQLGAEELPLSRLLILLDWLQLSLAELHKLAESSELENPKYTARQNEFLVKDGLAFAFLMKLYDPEMTPESIAEKYALDPTQVDRILIQLEKHDLIRVGVRGHVKPAHPRMPALDGALGAAHMHNVINRLAQYFKLRIANAIALRARNVETEPGGISAMVYEVTPKTYKDFMERVSRLSRDLDSAANIDRNSNPKSKLKNAVVMHGFFLDEVNSPDLELVSDVLGDVLRTPQSGSS